MRQEPQGAPSPVDAGWSALERGDWQAAKRSLSRATDGSDDPRAFEGLAWALWWCNDDAVFDARERAYLLYRNRGEPAAAARMAIWLGSDHHDFRAEHAVANGWYQRARRLLADEPTCAEHGWLAFQEGAYALELDEATGTARARAADVATIARELDHGDLGFLALALDGLALVTEGAVDDGMRRLDEVGVAATTGEFHDRVANSWSLCYLIYACERVHDFDRASQWCARMRDLATRNVFELGMGVCRAHYGGVLVVHGRWEHAEIELVAAGEALARSRPLAVAESAVRLAELRRRQGRVDEAATVFEETIPHPLAVVGLARIELDRGNPARAVEMLDDLMATIPRTSVTQRTDALELLARGRGAIGDAAGATTAADELRSIASIVRTGPVRAMAAAASAAAFEAADDLGMARRNMEEAVELFERSGLQYESDCARIELARILSRLDRSADADRHASRAERRLLALGALYAAQRAADIVRAGAATGNSPLAVLSPRECEVITLLAEGLTDREIAERLHISGHTAHRHVSNILTKLDVSGRAAAAAMAATHGLGPGPIRPRAAKPISS